MNTNLPKQTTRNNLRALLNVRLLSATKNILLLFLIVSNLNVLGQSEGDYRTNGTGNWDALATWRRYNGTNWNNAPTAAQGYPGQNATSSTATVTIQNGHNITLNVSPAYSIGALTINNGNATTTLTVGSNSLSVKNATTITSSTNNAYKSINVTNGSYSTGSVSLNSDGNTRDAFIQISGTGTVNVTGNITMNSTDGRRNYILFTGNGTLNVGGTITGGIITSTTGGHQTSGPTSGTVNYNALGNQDVGAYTYWTLTTSGSGTKTLQANTTVRNLDIGGATTLATQQYSITGNTAGNLSVGDGATLSLGSTSNNTNVQFPSNFSSARISLHNNSTVIYQSRAAQTVSPAPSSYGNILVMGGNTKTINGTILIENGLTLDNTRLATGAEGTNIVLGKNATISVNSGTFNSNQMIVCNGNGSLVKEAAQTSDLIMVYPIGTGPDNAYTPVEVISLTATINSIGSFSVRTTNERGDYTNLNDLKRYWVTSSNNLSNISAGMQFAYVAGDVLGTESEYGPMFLGGETWINAPGGSAPGSNPFSISGASNITGQWTLREPIKTYYSYQSGNWNTATTWTTDPSGSLSEKQGIPQMQDRVVILNGRTVTISQNEKKSYSLQLNEGGILDISTTTGHDFTTVSGQGTIRLASTTFPSGDFSKFDEAGAGTVEYNNTSNFTFNKTTYNNLILNLSTSGRVATINNNMTINGSFSIKTGALQITSATNRTISINENVLVENGGSISIGNVNGIHNFIVGGDFTNNGTVNFSTLTAADYTSTNNRHVDVIFNNPSKDQYLQCNGLTAFYNLVVNKGLDQTYILNIDASDVDNFRLYGKNNLRESGTEPNIINNKALEIYAGTLRLGENINIPSLCNGSESYVIDEDAMLWLDGATVRFSTSTMGDGSTFLLYGGYKQTGNSSFNDNSKQGFVVRNTGQIFIEGGTLSTEIIRTSYQPGTHRGSFTMSDGEVTLRGNGLPNLSGIGIYATFTLPYPTNAIDISGGVINILSPNTTGSAGGGTQGQNVSILVGADPNNINVTGGTVNLTLATNVTHITSTMPFWDLNIISNTASRYAQPRAYTASSNINAIPVQPLVVLNNLTLNNRAVLTSGNSNVDVIVGGDFTIPNNTTYTPGTNTTIFNGTGAQTFTNSGTITSGLYKMSIINGSELSLGGSATDFIIRNDFEIGQESALRDNNKVISVAGNIINSGTHIRPAGAAGRIVLNGNVAQDISGDGNGQFNNLAIDKTGGTLTVSSDIRVNGAFSLVRNIRVNLGSNKLTLGEEGAVYSALGTGQTFNNNKMILTQGMGSDGGIRKMVDREETILLPYGFLNSANNTYYYLPSTIQYNGTVAGTIASRPVNERHPLAQGANNALRVYWKNTTTGFDGVSGSAFTLRFTYNDYFVTGTENSYIPGVYRFGTSWNLLNDPTAINPVANTITFANQPTAKGEHTAGYTSAFTTIPILYSRGDGDWDDFSTWSETGHDGVAATFTPNSTTLVVIGNGSEFNHKISISNNNKRAGGLKLATGSMLNLTTSQGHNFSSIPEESVTGGGTLRISSSNYFPQGDFGDFIGPNGGTVEYYSNATNITVPTLSDVTLLPLNQYRNLILRNGSYSITLPNRNLTIHENILCVGGSSNIQVSSNSTTINILGDFTIDKTSFNINGGNKNIAIFGTLSNINTGRLLIANNAATTNKIEIYGDIINDGSINLNNGTGAMETIFRGEKNTVISGAGGTYRFYKITVDKGTNRDATVTLLSSIEVTNANPLLVLKNGTFRVNREDAEVYVTDGSTDFVIPQTASLSVLNGNVTIANGNGNAKLSLAGRLEVLGGKMFIGNVSNNRNNSIEYAAAGSPEIIVDNGELHVNGQIRRLTSVTSGNLHYKQSGGTTTIYGKVREASRGLFEIDNLGSLFTMSGGTLQFDRPSAVGTTFGDMVLRPDSLNVTGGTIKFGLPTSASDYNFKMSASSPLWDLAIGDESSSQYLTTTVFGITVMGELLINQSSQFRANGLDVTLKGNFTNKNISAASGINSGGYQPGTSTHTTIFSGVSQSVTGSGTNLTNFANMLVMPTTSVTLSNNTMLKINNDLEIKKGTFIDGSNSVFVLGNILNTSTHVSTSSVGGLLLTGTRNQKLSGLNGVYGNIFIDNSNGISLLNNATINGKLTFENGLLYIDDYLLTFGVNSIIEGIPDASKMIMLNGALSDQGVKKLFPSGASSFTMPIGIPEKYTPATYTITTNSAPGTITVRPVNRNHPAIADDEPNELDYYWNVDSTGFGSNLRLTHKYQYLSEDVSSDESQYVVGIYRFRDFYWTDLGDNDAPGRVDEATHSLNVSNVGFVTGDYTAGYQINFTPPLEIYYSRNSRPNNNWTNASNWSTVGHNDNTHIATVPPRGNPVIIAEGHTMVLNQDAQYQVSVEVNGTLDCGKTVFHNLGIVYGTGKIKLESTNDGFYVFPGGAYDNFFATPGTILEFTGSNYATLPLKPGNIYKPYNNVILSGPGQKNMSAENIKIVGNLTIKNGTKLSNTLHNKNLYILGDWINENTSALSFIAGKGTVFVDGIQPQNMNVAIQEKFYNLTMQNAQGLTLTNKGIEVAQTLKLTSGIIHSDVNREVTLSHTTASIAVSGVNATSFVDGPVKKRIISGQSFNFPTGSDGRLGRINITNATSAVAQPYWTAQYFNSNPNPTYPTEILNLTAPITTVSDNEYWIVGRPTPTSAANIHLRWDATSLPGHTGSAITRPMLRVVEFEGGGQNKWTVRGQAVSGNATTGTVSTTTPVTQNDYIFSLGAIGVTAAINDLIPISICDNDEIAQVAVTLTGVPPYTLAYRTTGSTTTNFVETNILTSPYVISLQGSDIGGYSPTPYTLELVSVSANGITGFVNPGTVSIEVKLTHKPIIAGATSVATNETRIYSTPSHAGSTFTWEWVGTPGGIITSAGNQVSIKFNGTIGTRTLRVTETSISGCSAYDEIVITVQNTPAPKISYDIVNLCKGILKSYSTNFNPSNEYFWTVSGGDCVGCDNWDNTNAEITVSWNNTGEGYVKVEERVKSTPSIKSYDSVGVYVYQMPTNKLVHGELTCKNEEAIIRVENSEYGISYQLVGYYSGEDVGTPVPGTGDDIFLSAGNITESALYYVVAYNLGCKATLPPDGNVGAIVSKPEVDLVVDDTDHIICQGTETQFTATSVSEYYDAVTNFEYIINGTTIQKSGVNTYSTSVLQNKDTIYVIGETDLGCRDTSKTIVVSVGNQIWSGEISTAWNNTGNWACPDLPNLERNVIIPEQAQNMPIINSNSTVKIIEIEEGATLLHNNGIFSIAGDIINNGTFSSAATVELTGSNEQHLINNTEFNFNNLTINKQAGTVNLETKTNITGFLTLSSGIVNTTSSNILTIENGASSTHGNDTSYINGPLQKIGNNGYTFPIGTNNRWARIAITDIEGGNASTRTIAQYTHASYPNLVDMTPSLNNVTEVEYWDLSNPTNDMTCNVILYTENVKRSNINVLDLPDLRVAHFDGIEWKDHGNGGVDVSDNRGWLKSGTKLTSFSPITFASKTGSNPLPVELINFKAYLNNGQSVLSWLTATERNNSHFDIEWSDNMNSFTKIATIYSKAQNGNSTQVIDYGYNDNAPKIGVNYYRLKQTDFNGNYAYSPVVSVTYNGENSLLESISVYPNPTKGLVNIVVPSIDENIYISIYNSNGTLLADYKYNPLDPVIDLLQYANGLYMIKISNDEKHIIQRIIKQ